MPASNPAKVEGYAFFIKLLALERQTPIEVSARLFRELIGLVFTDLSLDEDRWYPSPFGAALHGGDSASAMLLAPKLIQSATRRKLSIGVGLVKARFNPVYTCNRWNVSSPGVNKAARLAFADTARGRILTDLDTKLALAASGPWKHAFDGPRPVKIKRGELDAFTLNVDGCSQFEAVEVPSAMAPSEVGSPRDYAVLLFDIEGYSSMTPAKQVEVLDDLGKIVGRTMQSFRTNPADYDSAGDGGHIVFAPDARGASVPACWEFGEKLAKDCKTKGIRLRFGFHHGPLMKVENPSAAEGCKEMAVGPTVLVAEHASALAEVDWPVATSAFRDLMNPESGLGWERLKSDSNLFLLTKRGAKTRQRGPAIATADPAELRSRLSIAVVNLCRTLPRLASNKQDAATPARILGEQALKMAAKAVVDRLSIPSKLSFSVNLMVPVPVRPGKGFDWAPTTEHAKNAKHARQLWASWAGEASVLLVAVAEAREKETNDHPRVCGFWIPVVRSEDHNDLPGAPAAYLNASPSYFAKHQPPQLKGFDAPLKKRWRQWLKKRYKYNVCLSLPFAIQLVPERVAVLNVNIGLESPKARKWVPDRDALEQAASAVEPFVSLALLALATEVAGKGDLASLQLDWEKLAAIL